MSLEELAAVQDPVAGLITPELLEALAQAGATALVVVLMLWRAWSDVTERLKGIDREVHDVGRATQALERRLITLEVRAEERRHGDFPPSPVG